MGETGVGVLVGVGGGVEVGVGLGVFGGDGTGVGPESNDIVPSP